LKLGEKEVDNNMGIKMKLPELRYNFKLSANLALITGLTMGVMAAVAQGYFEVQPPVGLGVCAITHPSNLVNWVVNNVFGTEFNTRYFCGGTCAYSNWLDNRFVCSCLKK